MSPVEGRPYLEGPDESGAPEDEDVQLARGFLGWWLAVAMGGLRAPRLPGEAPNPSAPPAAADSLMKSFREVLMGVEAPGAGAGDRRI